MKNTVPTPTSSLEISAKTHKPAPDETATKGTKVVTLACTCIMQHVSKKQASLAEAELISMIQQLYPISAHEDSYLLSLPIFTWKGKTVTPYIKASFQKTETKDTTLRGLVRDIIGNDENDNNYFPCINVDNLRNEVASFLQRYWGDYWGDTRCFNLPSLASAEGYDNNSIYLSAGNDSVPNISLCFSTDEMTSDKGISVYWHTVPNTWYGISERSGFSSFDVFFNEIHNATKKGFFTPRKFLKHLKKLSRSIRRYHSKSYFSNKGMSVNVPVYGKYDTFYALFSYTETDEKLSLPSEITNVLLTLNTMPTLDVLGEISNDNFSIGDPEWYAPFQPIVIGDFTLTPCIKACEGYIIVGTIESSDGKRMALALGISTSV